MLRGIIALVFRCKISGGHLTRNDEVTAFHWADQADIGQLTSEAYAIRLLDALREDTAPAIRQHDGTELTGSSREHTNEVRQAPSSPAFGVSVRRPAAGR